MHVVTGCDRHREFLLEPFIYYLRKTNPTIGLTIADFGMTPIARAFAKSKADVIDVGPPETPHVYDLLMLKPKAMLLIPESEGLWLDTDVQVCQSLAPFADYKFAAQWNTATWNTGILKYQRDHPVMKEWATLKRDRGSKFAGGHETVYTGAEHDEHVFLRALKIHSVRMHNLEWQEAGLFQHHHRKSSICIHWMGADEKQFYMRIFSGVPKTT